MCLPGRSSDFDAHANLQSCALTHNIIIIYWQAGECKRLIDEGEGVYTRTVAVPVVKLPWGGCCDPRVLRTHQARRQNFVIIHYY